VLREETQVQDQVNARVLFFGHLNLLFQPLVVIVAHQRQHHSFAGAAHYFLCDIVDQGHSAEVVRNKHVLLFFFLVCGLVTESLQKHFLCDLFLSLLALGILFHEVDNKDKLVVAQIGGSLSNGQVKEKLAPEVNLAFLEGAHWRLEAFLQLL
jgi:hypothetical protein